MSRKITVALTFEQIDGMLHAMGEVLDHPDAVESSYGSYRAAGPAFRGREILEKAWVPEYRRRRAREEEA